MKTLLLLAVSAGVAFQGQREQRWTEPARIDALRRAVIWQPPAVPIEAADLSRTPGALPDEVRCRFKVDDVSGLTPKFECELSDGEVVKVKYSGPEPYGEVAASRLLRTLGFGADRVFFVKRVRCYGCPRYPFPLLKLVTLVGAEKIFAKGVDYDSAVDFEWPSIERKSAGEKIETSQGRGWAFHELAKAPTASRVHADALTLMAVFLAHWDNKPENQRLVCLSGTPARDGRCARPMAMLQDVGGTFGPRKTDLDGWRGAPIWKDRPSCTVSMQTMPHGGATFVDTKISEKGRRFLADRLTRLSDAQIDALFRGARFDQHDGTIPEWTALFKARVQAIASGPACPS
ncbi:MAG: hypothetical protein JJE40_07680 [Vicinamibacteria bacterium]|nr:hypothetical protein [Vicinamibacteria bacterium]